MKVSMPIPTSVVKAATPFTVAVLGLLLSLTGCSSHLSKNEAQLETQSLPTVEYRPGELNRETLYDLIVAEIAGQRKQGNQSVTSNLFVEKSLEHQ